jgi:hypothetical protein
MDGCKVAFSDQAPPGRLPARRDAIGAAVPGKRRLKNAGQPSRLSPHSFSVTAITSLLEQWVPMEEVQYLAEHAEHRRANSDLIIIRLV